MKRLLFSILILPLYYLLAEAGPLPETATPSVAAVRIDSDAVSLYRELLLPEVADWISDRGLVIEAGKTLKVSPVIVDHSNQLNPCDLERSQVESWPTAAPNGATGGRLYPLQKALACKSVEEQGGALLWNTLSLPWSMRGFQYNFDLLLFPDKQVVRRLTGSLRKIFPRAFEASSELRQLSREMLELSTPKILSDYKWLTFRLGTTEEDAVWVKSPALRSVRQLTQSNTGDAIIPGAPSIDDFFVWSGKPNIVRADRLERRRLLVPFRETESSRWNFESSKFVSAAGWIPTDTLWVPRDVIVVSGRVGDPFYLSGYESIVVDLETTLPVMRISFNRTGQAQKLLIGVTSVVQQLPYIADTIVRDLSAGTVAVIRGAGLKAVELAASDFDPKRL